MMFLLIIILLIEINISLPWDPTCDNCIINNRNVACEFGPCDINCYANNACNGYNISCSTDTICNIGCHNQSACQDTIIFAMLAQKLTVNIISKEEQGTQYDWLQSFFFPKTCVYFTVHSGCLPGTPQ